MLRWFPQRFHQSDAATNSHDQYLRKPPHNSLWYYQVPKKEVAKQNRYYGRNSGRYFSTTEKQTPKSEQPFFTCNVPKRLLKRGFWAEKNMQASPNCILNIWSVHTGIFLFTVSLSTDPKKNCWTESTLPVVHCVLQQLCHPVNYRAPANSETKCTHRWRERERKMEIIIIIIQKIIKRRSDQQNTFCKSSDNNWLHCSNKWADAFERSTTPNIEANAH